MMLSIEKKILQFKEIAENPKKYVSNFIDETGSKVIGCLLGYCPEELVHAAGMLPVGLWGGDVDISLAKKYLPAFLCSPVQQCLELGMRGEYKDLSGVIIPGLCDTLNTLGQNWKVALPNIKFIPIVYPQNKNQDFGVEFLISEYKEIIRKLEEISGNKITDESLRRSIEIYNSNRRAMRDFLELATRYQHIFTPLIRHQIVKSRYFIPKEKHTQMLHELMEELKCVDEKESNLKRIIVTGIKLDSKEVLESFTDNNMAIVGDDLLHESRQLRTDVPMISNDPLVCLAQRWRSMDNCSLIMNPKKERANMLVNMAKEKKADGIIVCLTTFCDPEEYDYPILKKVFEKHSIPHIQIEMNDISSIEQVKIRLQTFGEILQSHLN